MTKITDTETNTKHRVCRTYRTSDKLALLHVTDDRRVWLDCTNGGPGRMSYVGKLPEDEKMTREAAIRAANQ